MLSNSLESKTETGFGLKVRVGKTRIDLFVPTNDEYDMDLLGSWAVTESDKTNTEGGSDLEFIADLVVILV
jgi:hypothetical protein